MSHRLVARASRKLQGRLNRASTSTSFCRCRFLSVLERDLGACPVPVHGVTGSAAAPRAGPLRCGGMHFEVMHGSASGLAWIRLHGVLCASCAWCVSSGWGIVRCCAPRSGGSWQDLPYSQYRRIPNLFQYSNRLEFARSVHMCRLGCYRRNAKAGTSSARPLSADRFSAAAFSKEIGHFINRQTQNVRLVGSQRLAAL